MKDPLFNKLSGLAALGIVLVAVLLAGDGRDLSASQAVQPGLIQGLEAEGLEAAEQAAGPQRKSRRVRASLSMPYFSFAQSLRPRG